MNRWKIVASGVVTIHMLFKKNHAIHKNVLLGFNCGLVGVGNTVNSGVYYRKMLSNFFFQWNQFQQNFEANQISWSTGHPNLTPLDLFLWGTCLVWNIYFQFANQSVFKRIFWFSKTFYVGLHFNLTEFSSARGTTLTNWTLRIAQYLSHFLSSIITQKSNFLRKKRP